MSWYSVPPNATLSTCNPRQMPSTGLPASMNARKSAISIRHARDRGPFGRSGCSP
jgi:hypothetical protein